MSDKPKRRFWQIHSSTAVVLMIVASLCLAIIVAAWQDIEEFKNVPLENLGYRPSTAILTRKQHADYVLLYGPPLTLILLTVIGAAMERAIFREAGKP